MCITPVPLKMDTIKWKSRKPLSDIKGDTVNVPCGRCIECRRSYVNQWIFRISNEYKACTTDKAYFLTLTYNDDNLYDPSNGLITDCGEFNLNYKHHQDYIKRLRKSYEKTEKHPIKYFTVGEYGDKSDRPHFHSIIFNADQQNIIDAWGRGNVHFGEVSEASIAYTLKYAVKRLARVYKRGYKESQDSREKERALISRGLGASYLTTDIIKYYQNDITRSVRKEGGQMVALPRYYKQRIYTEAQQEARSRLSLSTMESKHSESDVREKQVISVREYQKETKKQKERKITGY